MPLQVECYAGYRGEQEPQAFRLGERRLAVSVVDRWYSPTQRWFRVTAEDGDTYILRHDEADDQWELAAFTSAKSPGTAKEDELGVGSDQSGIRRSRPPDS